MRLSKSQITSTLAVAGVVFGIVCAARAGRPPETPLASQVKSSSTVNATFPRRRTTHLRRQQITWALMRAAVTQAQVTAESVLRSRPANPSARRPNRGDGPIVVASSICSVPYSGLYRRRNVGTGSIPKGSCQH